MKRGPWKGSARALLLCAVVHSSPGATVQGPPLSNARLAKVRALPFIDLYRRIAGPLWVDRHSQARAESALNPRARAADGGMGLGQFMPRTWAEWGHGDPFDPTANATAQHAYDNHLTARFPVPDGYLIAYNAGPGSAARALRHVDALGLQGADAMLRVLPRVTGAENATITTSYVARNRQYRAELRAAFPGVE